MNRLKDESKYEDIIHLSHPISASHTQMSIRDRAAQFSPFAALTGYDAAIKETGRLTNARMEIDEDGKSRLDEKIQMLMEVLEEKPLVTITFFLPDEKKAGGAYVNVTGYIKKIDKYARTIILTDKTIIAMDEICQIDCEMFRFLDF